MRLRRAAVQAHIAISDTTRGLPYSKGLMASSVMIAGVPPAQAYRVAELVEQVLNERGVRQISSAELRNLATSVLAEMDERHASTYRQWQVVEELDQPLIILLGGATGVGKSTIATQLAVRLGITRVISTDAIREVLRAAFSQKLIPTLYVSSFNADEALRVPISSSSEQLIVGFQEQVTAVSVGIKALIARALEEGTDIIVEGAHVVPGFLEGWEEEFDQAVLVPVVMRVSDAEMHRSHFAMRARESRPRDRYIENFEKIRALQDYIVGLAEKAGAPVVEMFDLDATVQQIAAIVVDKALEKAQGGGPSTNGAAGSIGTPGREPSLKSWELLGARRKG